MLRNHMTACMLATMFVAAPALAQNTTTTTPATPSLQTAAPAQSGSASGSAPTMVTGGQAMKGDRMAAPNQGLRANVDYIAERHPGSYRASDLMGKDVYGANNEDIGEVNDVIIGQNGQVMAVVVGVGGFLGIGEKDVAVPMQSLQFRADSAQDVTQTGAVGNNAATSSTTMATGNATMNAPGTTASPTAGRSDPLPDRIVLSATKEQLEAAPNFRDNIRPTAGTARQPMGAQPVAPTNNPGVNTAPNTVAPRQ